MKSITSESTAALRQQVLARYHHKRAKSGPKTSVIAVYASVFALIIAAVAVGYRQPQAKTGIANAATLTATSQAQPTSVDQVVASNIAASVAQTANLSVAPNVANMAVSAKISSQLAQSSDTSITKPQIIQPTSQSRAVTSYVTKTGDTTDSVAAANGISKDTLKWANNLTSDALDPGKTLKILPTDGVLYTVKAGDTAQSIGDKYKVDPTRIILYNDLDQSGIQSGMQIILPSATLPTNERPGYVAPVQVNYNYAVTTYIGGYSAGFGGNSWRIRVGTAPNGYAFGNCTAYAYNRRVELGLPVGGNWGNAATWAVAARSSGLLVNNTPSVGAIMQNGGWLGHVSIVESILDNGDLSISEMNASVSGGGFNIVSGRIIPASVVGQYVFIH